MSAVAPVRPPRTVPGEVVRVQDQPPRRSPWAPQEAVCHVHPAADPQPWSLRRAWARDRGMQWWAVTGVTGVVLALNAPTYVWWAALPGVASVVLDWVRDWELLVAEWQDDHGEMHREPE